MFTSDQLSGWTSEQIETWCRVNGVMMLVAVCKGGTWRVDVHMADEREHVGEGVDLLAAMATAFNAVTLVVN